MFCEMEEYVFRENLGRKMLLHVNSSQQNQIRNVFQISDCYLYELFIAKTYSI